ncbi:MAG: hydroxymethylbilane synthase [Verrucomicrobiae bacterium]|nr:hydroxymethylbilane synthase [Verrucomicrobiae bacterium]
MKPFIIGTRGSALALAQTTWVKDQLQKNFPSQTFELRLIKTQGDQLQKQNESAITSSTTPLSKGLFTKELENALLTKEIDFAVHSLKDLPTELTPELTIAAIPQRASAHDVLITRYETRFEDLPKNAHLATGSPRRQQELLRLRPDLQFSAIRGNIDTRLKKLEQNSDWHGLVLAAAGLERLSPETSNLKIIPLSYDILLPSPGQGALAIQTRTHDSQSQALAQSLDDPITRCCVETERQFLAGFGGGCQFPLGAYGYLKENFEEKTKFIHLIVRLYLNRPTGLKFEYYFPFENASILSYKSACKEKASIY